MQASHLRQGHDQALTNLLHLAVQSLKGVSKPPEHEEEEERLERRGIALGYQADGIAPVLGAGSPRLASLRADCRWEARAQHEKLLPREFEERQRVFQEHSVAASSSAGLGVMGHARPPEEVPWKVRLHQQPRPLLEPAEGLEMQPASLGHSVASASSGQRRGFEQHEFLAWAERSAAAASSEQQDSARTERTAAANPVLSPPGVAPRAPQAGASDAGLGQNDVVEAPPSPGSVGHPFQCAEACKYHTKPRGCKDGAACDRCHLCVWRAPARHPGVGFRSRGGCGRRTDGAAGA